MSKDIEVAVLFCPPHSHYKKQPSDMSKCELVDCPSCNKKMWLSEKKKKIKENWLLMGKQVINECYLCFAERSKEPETWSDSVIINI